MSDHTHTHTETQKQKQKHELLKLNDFNPLTPFNSHYLYDTHTY